MSHLLMSHFANTCAGNHEEESEFRYGDDYLDTFDCETNWEVPAPLGGNDHTQCGMSYRFDTPDVHDAHDARDAHDTQDAQDAHDAVNVQVDWTRAGIPELLQGFAVQLELCVLMMSAA